MKRILVVMLLVPTVAVLIVANYAKASPEKIKIVSAGFAAPRDIYTREMIKFKELIEKATNGRVEIINNPSSSLIKAEDALKAVRTGIVDVVSIHTWVFPAELQFNNWASSLSAFIYTWNMLYPDVYKLLKQDSATGGEFAKLNVRHMWDIPNSGELFFNFPASPGFERNSWVGKKICQASPTDTPIIEHCGGTPVKISSAEVPTGLSTGVINGLLTNYSAYDSMDLYALAPYVLVTGRRNFIGYHPRVMNLNTWRKLPKDIQEVWLKVEDQVMEWGTQESRSVTENVLEKMKKKAKVTFLTPEQQAYYASLFVAQTKDFVSRFGAPAKNWVDTVEKIQAKYEK